MDAHAAPTSESRHCPVCEYDLRGNTSGRCPECGTIIVSVGYSRIPWLYQQARGGVTAYLQTILLLLFHPGDLAKEAGQRVQHQPAHRFHQESMALATFFAAGFLTIIFLIRGTTMENWLNPPIDVMLGMRKQSLWWMPVYVWTDQLYLLIPLLPALYFSFRVSAWVYRFFFRFGKGQTHLERRRATRLAYYGSGLAPIISILLGLFALLLIFSGEEWRWAIGGWKPLLVAAAALLALAGVAGFSYTTLVLLARVGKGGPRHAAAMILSFPLILAVVWYTIPLVIFWVTGYIVLACWAMMH